MADKKNYVSAVQEKKRDLANTLEEGRRECDHKAGPHGRIVMLKDSNANYPGKDQMPDTTVYCQTCTAVFESQAYTPEELQSGIYMFQSMLHQIKLNARLSDADRDDIANAFASLDTISKVVTYYNDMVKKMSKGGGGNNGGGGSNKGHMGMSRGLMSGRSY